MGRVLILAACVVLAGAQPGGAAASPARVRPKVAAPAAAAARVTTTRLIRSRDGRLFKVFISTPAGPAPKAGFPVIYVLDGNAWFGVAAGLAGVKDEEFPHAVVVGVGYPGRAAFDERRVGDLTPFKPAEPLLFGQSDKTAGGADAFADFVAGELPAELGRTLRLDPHRRTLFGHSLGGLFVLHVLFTRPASFDAYVAASPSIWWNRPALLAEAAAARFPAPAPRVLVTAGALETVLGDFDKDYVRQQFRTAPGQYAGKTLDQAFEEVRRKLADNRMPENARDMAVLLRDRGLDAAYVEFADEDHMSVAPAALNRTFRFALKPPAAPSAR